MDEAPPLHMDRWTRNERLYQTLLGMGLVVSPIRLSSDPSKIDYLHVSAELPAQSASEQASEAGIGLVVERPQIREIIRPAKSDGNGVVVELPTVRR